MTRTVKSLTTLLKDSESGSSTILKHTMEWAIGQTKKKVSPEKILNGLNNLCTAHPSMALLQSFHRHFQKAPLTIEELNQWRDTYENHEKQACQHFAEYLSSRKSILVHSNSSLLLKSLQLVTQPLQIYCTESRPAREGITLAEELAGSKHKVILFTDIAAFTAISQIDILAFGCDVITTSGIVNKIGTAALAKAGHSAGKEACFVGTSEKIIKEWKDDFLQRQGPPAEIYQGKKPVEVHNFYFDVTPPEFVRYIFLETGRFSLSG